MSNTSTEPPNGTHIFTDTRSRGSLFLYRPVRPSDGQTSPFTSNFTSDVTVGSKNTGVEASKHVCAVFKESV